MSLDLQEVVAQTKSGQISVSQRLKEAFLKIEQTANLNIFTEVFTQSAEAQAQALEAKLKKRQKLGRLAGLIFSVKDNFLYKGTKTTAAAPFLQNFIAPYTASCLDKLLAEDAILLGKTNLDAFAHGTSTENSCFGATKNPHDLDRTAGGSSGGSAAAVATSVTDFALGTDTGGSVRLPASFCGITGFKPTYGLLSRYGIVAMASSTDCVSLLTQKPSEALFLTDLLKGRDNLDATTLETNKLDLLAQKPSKTLKVGIIKEFINQLDTDVAQAFEQSLDLLREANCQLQTISLPNINFALACYYVLVSAEVSSNLSRYDGLRYGQKKSANSWQATISRSRQSGFMAENKRRILLGTYVLSQGYYEAYYQKAQKLRTLLCQEFQRAFEQVDCLISPTSPTTAFALGSKTKQPLQMYLADLMTVAASLTGIPATSLPLKTKGLPIGLQVMTPQKTDGLNLQIANQIFQRQA